MPDNLSPEEQTLISNIEALLAQLKQSATGAAAGAAAPEVTASVDAPPADPAAAPAAEDPAKKNLDQIANKSSEGATADDSAEQRLDDMPEEALANVDEVAKTHLRQLVKKGKIIITTPDRINKSYGTRITAIAKSVQMLAQVVKGVMADQEETMEAVKGVLEGMGVADTIQKSLQAQRQSGVATQVNKSQPIINPDQQTLIDLLQKGMSVAKAAEHAPAQVGVADRNGVRKSLADIMPQLAGQ